MKAVALPLRLQTGEHFHGPVFFELHVRRFQIAMDHARLVSRFERLRDLLGDRDRLVDRNRPLLDTLSKRRVFDELENERAVFEPVDAHDVRMVQRREKLGFPFESGNAFFVGSELIGKIPVRPRTRPSNTPSSKKSSSPTSTRTPRDSRPRYAMDRVTAAPPCGRLH